MKKTFIAFLMIFGLFVLFACDKTTTEEITSSTTTATTESTETTTTEEPVVTKENNEIFIELSDRLGAFWEDSSDFGTLEISMFTGMMLYMGGLDESNLLMEEGITTNTVIGIQEPWMYTETYFGSNGDEMFELYEFIDGSIVYTLAYDGMVSAINLFEEASISDFEDLVNGTESTGLILPASASYSRISVEEYQVHMSFGEFIELDESMLDSELGMDEIWSEVDMDQDVYMYFMFDEANNQMIMSILIDSLCLDEEIGYYMTMDLNEIIILNESPVKPSMPYSYKIIGGSSISESYLQLYPSRDHQLFLEQGTNNFYKLYLTEGFYVIDDQYRLYGETEIRLYSESGSLISGKGLYAIPTEGYYYVNFKNVAEFDITSEPSIFKLDESMVGTPSNPIFMTENPFSISESDTYFYLFDDAVPKTGFLILHDISGGTSPYRPYMLGNSEAPEFQDDIWDTGTYRMFLMSYNNPIGLKFEKIMGEGTGTYEWWFLTQLPINWDHNTMLEITFDEPTIIAFFMNNSAQNYKFTITEEQTVSFEFAKWYSPCLYGDVLVNLYDSSGTMIGNNILYDEITLTPGDYFLNINASGVTTEGPVYIFLPYIYFVLEMVSVE